MNWKIIKKWIGKHRVVTGGIVAGCAVIILGVGYGVWSVGVWSGYQKEYRAATDSLRAEIDAALALPQATQHEKSQKIDRLKQVMSGVKLPSCGVNSIFSWQRFFGVADSIQQECEEKLIKSEKTVEALNDVVAYFENEQALSAVIVSANSERNVTEDTFGLVVANWQAAVAKVKSFEVGDGFMPVKDVAEQSVVAIHGAWQQLSLAHESANRATYEEARAKLPEAYDRLAGIAPVSVKQLTLLLSALQTAYSQL